MTQEGLDQNVEMHQRAYDSLETPGFTMLVREASNKDLGIGAHVVRVNQGAVVTVRADDPASKKTDEEKEAVYAIVAREGLKTHKRWYVGELAALDDGEDEVVDVAKVSLILGQSAYSGVSSTGRSRGVFNKSISIVRKNYWGLLGGAILARQRAHLMNLEGGNTLAHSLVFVFPDKPTRNQEQPFRHAVSEMTTTFLVSNTGFS